MIIANCINIVKLSIKHNKKGFIIYKNSKNMNILKALIKVNIINFICMKNNYLIVYLNYHDDKPVFKNITNIFKPGHKKFISLKNLKKLNSKHNWVFILSTNKGLLNSFEAINMNVGGLLIAKLWN